ncbi:MAG: hypothetical protein IKU07_01715 [Oscillospiraceae bacterium]|nr:hypothetical protein [Oscillospiraceae bacterium]
MEKDELMKLLEQEETDEGAKLPAPEEDPLFPKAVDFALEAGQVTPGVLERALEIGYGRAARMVEAMEEMGLISPFVPMQPHTVLMTREQWEALQKK